jgi:hypothetical protein
MAAFMSSKEYDLSSLATAFRNFSENDNDT